MDQPPPSPKPEPIAPRLAIKETQALQVWTADRWTCRYCEELVFFPPAFRAMASRFGNHGYYHSNWKADHSPLLIRRGASVDHVVAVTRGGAHAMENFVTACWECNLKKGNDEGWLPKPQALGTTWDGLLAVFKGLAAEGSDGSERRWLKAILSLGL
jgi:HNH endonuclease